MSEPTDRELRELRQMVQIVQRRLEALEQRAGVSRAAPTAPAPRPTAVPVSAVQPSVPRPVGHQDSLETRIGRDWLNRIGVLSLVLGVAFFILYSFQYLGASAKIAIGFAAGAGLIGLGTWLERQRALRWYGLGLVGGGWAITYFTTYAMHHIPAVRLLPSASFDLWLLLLVAAGAVSHAVKYRSEHMTATALLLGFITTAISQVSYFTFLATALLVGALQWLVIRMGWPRLLLTAVAASYAIYFSWTHGQIHASPIIAVHVQSVAQAEFWLKAAFLALYWIGYSGAAFALPSGATEQRRTVMTASLVNALAFTHGLLLAMAPAYPHMKAAALLAIGAAYLLSVPVAAWRRLPELSNAHLLVGLAFVTLALPLKLSGEWVSTLWTVEVAGLTWLGLRNARWPYRVVAFGVACLTLLRFVAVDLDKTAPMVLGPWALPWRVVIGAIGIAAFGGAAACYRLPRFRATLHRLEAHAFHAYGIGAAFILWSLIWLEAPERWRLAAWAVESAGLLALGWWLRDRTARLLGGIGFTWTALGLLGTVVFMSRGMWSGWAVAVTIALLFAASWVYRRPPAGERFPIEEHTHALYALSTVVVLTWWLDRDVSRYWLSVAWAVEGLALVSVGLRLPDKVFRVAGLAVFALLVGKILFVDLAAAETIYRILSFIIAGIILLAASYAYARFAARLMARSRAE